MADNDEYQFTELDPINPSGVEEEQAAQESGEKASKPIGMFEGNNVKRNAIIAVVLFISLMIVYKMVGSYFFNKKTEIAPLPNSFTSPTPPPIVEPPQPVSVMPAPSVIPTTKDSNLELKLSKMEKDQENLSSEISTVNGQMGDITSNIQALTNKITDLNRIITSLSDKLETQSQEIVRLSAKATTKPRIHTARPVRHYLHYYVQAVIPGRAWLVATNGSTLTVREGSKIPGYGIVKLIDPNQGRVMTSSGQIIRFSQDDS